MDKPKKPASSFVGYAQPPVETQFKPGQSGNPNGRPKGAKGTKATVRSVLLETHAADTTGMGQREQHTALELVLVKLKALAARGDQSAHRQLMDLEQRFGPRKDDAPIGYLIVPERLSLEEWEAKYSPKGGPPSESSDFD